MAVNNNDLQERKRLLQELNVMEAKLKEAGVDDTITRISDPAAASMAALAVAIDKAKDKLLALDDSATSLNERLKGITSEFGRQLTSLGKVRNSLRTITREAQKLRDDEQGIADLNRHQVESLQRKVKINRNLISQEKSALEELKSQYLLQNRNVEEIEAALNLLHDQDNAIDELIHLSEKRLQLERDISKNMGVMGALVGGTGALMERLGMRSGIFHDAMQDSVETMRQMSRVAGKNASILQKWNIAATGFSIVAKGFAGALKDPAVIIGAMVEGFLQVNKASVDFERLTGQSAVNLAGANYRLASSVDFLETAAELTRQIGFGATNIFTATEIANLAEAKNLLGLSAEQAGNLGVKSKVAGTSIDRYKESIVDATNSYNATNKKVVAHGIVLQDVLNTSDSIALSLAGNPKQIAKAAAAARSLGMELSKVDEIAGSLMNFSDSIGNELEAQLLTGLNINLAKARELALNNDLEGLSAELAKNGASAAQFANMNRIQQEALAKALGMSRDDLGKMAQQQLLAAGASAEQQAAARGVSIEQMEQMNIQERLSKSMSKLAQAFAPILDIITPMVEGISKIVTLVSGALGTGVGKFVGYLGTGLAMIRGISTAMAGIMLIQKSLNVSKLLELTLGKQYLTTLGLQGAAEAYKNTLKTEQNILLVVAAGLEKTMLGSILAQIGKATILLGVRIGLATAAMAENAALTLGVGVAVALAAAAAGAAAIKSMTKVDDMVSPGYGKRTLTGPEGSIQLNDKDTVIAGTDLFQPAQPINGGSINPGISNNSQTETSNITNINGANISTKQLENKLDQLIALVSKGGDVLLDGNKVGSALVMGSYKSS